MNPPPAFVVAGVQNIERWCSLHRNVEINYLVDCYEIAFYAQDGGEKVRSVRGESMMEALVEAGKLVLVQDGRNYVIR